MKVITYSKCDLERAASELLALVRGDGFAPSLVVGIATGGRKLGELMANLADPPLRFGYVRCQRVSTWVKKRSQMGVLMRSLPYALTDRLRLLEHWWNERHFRSRRDAVRVVAEDHVDGSVLSAMHETGRLRILVVDDAVDSGGTLKAVIAHLYDRFPGAEVKSAAVTVTFVEPLVRPDYALYLRGTLVRFHWSEDFRG